MAQLSPDERDRARQRVGTATMGIAILAAGAAGAASVLAWHATTETSAATVTNQDSDASRTGGDHEDRSGDQAGDRKQEGGDWSGLSGQGGLPPGGIPSTEPPRNSSGGGMVGSHGS